MTFPVYRAEARGILIKTSGFIARAGFAHFLSPAHAPREIVETMRSQAARAGRRFETGPRAFA